MLKYILVPLAAALIYAGVFQLDFIKTYFHDAESYMMTVQTLEGRPTLISSNQRKNVILKMLVKPGDTLNTAFKEKIILKYPDQTALTLEADTSLMLMESTDTKELQFLRGILQIDTEVQSEEAVLTVHTALTDIKIVQGSCRISLRGDKELIHVISGFIIIRNTSQGVEQKVTGGHYVTVHGNNLKVDKNQKKREN